jgi:hypothetical protein
MRNFLVLGPLNANGNAKKSLTRIQIVPVLDFCKRSIQCNCFRANPSSGLLGSAKKMVGFAVTKFYGI